MAKLKHRSWSPSSAYKTKARYFGRPIVGEIAGSRIHNLKELRPPSTSIRVLFVFDPRRAAILLVAGDKAEHGWKAWYVEAIPEAERLYAEYLEELRKEGLLE